MAHNYHLRIHLAHTEGVRDQRVMLFEVQKALSGYGELRRVFLINYDTIAFQILLVHRFVEDEELDNGRLMYTYTNSGSGRLPIFIAR